MKDIWKWAGALLALLLVVACAPGGAAAPAAAPSGQPAVSTELPRAFDEGFEEGLGAWHLGADVPQDPNRPGETVAWNVDVSNEQAASGESSVRLVLDGRQGGGTVWLARSFDVPANTDLRVDLALWLWSVAQSPDTIANVAAYAGDKPPTAEGDFDISQPANQVAGWQQYEYEFAVTSGADGRVWIAAGISVVADREVTYFLDGIEGLIDKAPAGTPVIRPPTALLIVDGARQESGVGSYCWGEPGGQGAAVCADSIGIITPVEPLAVAASFTAHFQFQLDDPASLVLNVRPVGQEDEIATSPAGERDWRAWSPGQGEQLRLAPQAATQVALALDPGVHVLSMLARWDKYGDVNYGWLVDVAGGLPGAEPAASPAGTPQVEAGRYVAPAGWSIAIPAGWDVVSEAPGFVQDSKTGKTISFESEEMSQEELERWMEAEVARKLAATEADNSLVDPVAVDVLDGGLTVLHYTILSRMEAQETLLRTTVFYDGTRRYAFYAAIPPVTEQEYQAVLSSFSPSLPATRGPD